MATQSEVKNTTIEDLKNFQDFVIGNSVSGLRAELDKMNRRLVILNTRQIELKNNETIIKARIINNADMARINSALAADSPKYPIQSMKNTGTVPSPDQNLGYDKFKLMSEIPGMKELLAELYKINNDIQTNLVKINAYTERRKEIQVQLDVAVQKKSTNFLDKTFGRVLPPKPEDLEMDRISKARATNLLLLSKLADSYKNYTTDPSTGGAGYPDNHKLAKNLIVIQQTFAAIAKGFPDNELIEGKNALNLENPGADENIIKLKELLGQERGVATNTKTGAEVAKFVEDLTALSQDTNSSEGIQKKPSPLLPFENSMRAQTSNYPASVLRLGDFYIGSFQLPSILDAVRKVWKQENQDLLSDLPICPNVTPPTRTDSDRKLLEQRMKNSAEQAAGTKEYQDKKDTIKGPSDKAAAKRIAELPDNAPDWVVQFVELYRDAEKGSFIVTEQVVLPITTGSEYPTINVSSQIYVAKGWNSEQRTAKTNADKGIATFFGGVLPQDPKATYTVIYFNYVKEGTWYYYARADKNL